MKKTLSMILTACVAMLSLAACSGDSSSSAAPASQPPASSAPAPAVSQASSPASVASVPAASTSAPAAAQEDLDAALATMAEAAELGNTIDVSEIDLKAGGINVDNVESFVGAQSQLAAQNGGIVIIVKAVSGTAETVAAEMESFRQYSLGNADYEEFEGARSNTENGIIKTYGDYVVYAVSATGNADAVTAAADAQFA